MKGNNELTLNQSSLVEAIDFYLRHAVWNEETGKRLKVEGVKLEQSSAYGGGSAVVMLTDSEP